MSLQKRNSNHVWVMFVNPFLFFDSLLPGTSAGNNFSLFTGHMSFQIFILVGHLTNWTGHNLLTHNTLKKITQDVLVRCSVIVSDHNVKLAGHFQNLVGQCPMTDCYFQHWVLSFSAPSRTTFLHVYVCASS